MERVKRRNRAGIPVYAKLALLAAFVLLLWCLTQRVEEDRAFQALPAPQEDALHWALITRDGGEIGEYGGLLPDAAQLETLAGMPVDVTVCTADKFMNLIAANAEIDVATRCYADPKLKRFETSGKTESLQRLLGRYLPDFQMPGEVQAWCGNTKGDVYAYPHTRTVGRTSRDAPAGVVMLANKKQMERYGIDSSAFLRKNDTVEALKIIRKAAPEIVPSYVDLSPLQQMFGARIVDEDGQWQDRFFQEETLEALVFLNRLYSERLLSKDVFTMSGGYLISQLREEKVFLAATETLYPMLQRLPEDDPIWENYEVVGPIAPDSGKEFQFRYNYNEQYASTSFLTESRFPEVQVRLLLWFYCQNMELTPEQRQAMEEGGYGELLEMELHTPPAVGGSYEQYAQPVFPYEILFAHYADTRLANIFESVESYRKSQEVRIVTSTSAEEVEQIYQETLLEMNNRGNELLIQWKQTKYQQASRLAE